MLVCVYDSCLCVVLLVCSGGIGFVLYFFQLVSGWLHFVVVLYCGL